MRNKLKNLKSYTRPFTKIKPSDIPEMYKLRKKGFSFQVIADKYKVDRSTIYYHLKKHYSDVLNLVPLIVRKKIKKIKKIKEKFGHKPVKMYKDYQQEQIDTNNPLDKFRAKE